MSGNSTEGGDYFIRSIFDFHVIFLIRYGNPNYASTCIVLFKLLVQYFWILRATKSTSLYRKLFILTNLGLVYNYFRRYFKGSIIIKHYTESEYNEGPTLQNISTTSDKPFQPTLESKINTQEMKTFQRQKYRAKRQIYPTHFLIKT